MISWSAKNNNSYLCGYRSSSSLREAARDAHTYVDRELCGEGIVTYWDGTNFDHPIREDEKSLRTGMQWSKRNPA